MADDKPKPKSKHVPGTMDRAMDWFSNIEPEKRRRSAFIMLVGSFMLGHVNIGMFMFGLIPPAVMDAITNYLSWLALTITALDLLVGTDVRVQQEANESE